MFGFFKDTLVIEDTDEIMKEGWLTKQSKYRKIWRDRWCVLTHGKFYTFEKQQVYLNPTEEINLAKVRGVRTEDDGENLILKIFTKDESYIFKAADSETRDAWSATINKILMVRSMKKEDKLIKNEEIIANIDY